MDLALSQRVQIDDLLLQREAQLLRVHDCEAAIEEILGQAYPFPDPPPLPSRQKRRRPSKAARAKKTGGPKPLALPPLSEGETAYRLIYRDSGHERSEEHMDAEALERWLDRPHRSIEVLGIQTIGADGKPRRTLDTAIRRSEGKGP